MVLRNKTMIFYLIMHILKVISAMEDQIICSGNHTLLDIPGDAVITVFVDTNYGPECNISSPKGFQEISTALYVVQALNKYDYLPGVLLGLKIYDTCHNEAILYKEALAAIVDVDCNNYYDLGILVPHNYAKSLQHLHNYSVVPVNTYIDENLQKPLIEMTVDFLARRFEEIDLLLIHSESILNIFLDVSRESGICVKNYGTDVHEVHELDELDRDYDNDTESVIVAIGHDHEIEKWVENDDQDGKKIWIVLPIDGNYTDDFLPKGSYVIKPSGLQLNLFQEYPSVNNFLYESERYVIHSPYLLGIGKAIAEIAESLKNLQKETCPLEEEICNLPKYQSSLRKKLDNFQIYDMLHILPKYQTIKYSVVRKNHDDSVTDVFGYKIDPNKGCKIIPEKSLPPMTKLCLDTSVSSCEKCINFHSNNVIHDLSQGLENSDRNFLKSGVLIPILLTIVACGILACVVIMIFIIYRFLVEELLDGNPTLTIFLILSNILLLITVLPFCMNDNYIDPEYLNSRKIFVSTLSLGLIFSTMLARALFLTFSTGSVFTTHINGYLQCLMAFFISGVEIAISTTYFCLNATNSSVTVRSLMFIALLSYDIFLLLMLFVVCCFIAQIQRNYREGRCFFGTVIGLLIVWAVWITCFILMEPQSRDIVVTFALISTGYLIIIGILIPRTYYMATRMSKEKDFIQRFDSIDLGPDPRMNSVARQSRQAFYDYVHPSDTILQTSRYPTYPNYYGSSSVRYQSNPRIARNPAYRNYGFHGEMREMGNTYVVPKVRIENPEGQISPMGRSVDANPYAQPRCTRRGKTRREDNKDCIETDVYVEGGRLSSSRRGPDEHYPSHTGSPKIGQVEATIREEDEVEDDYRGSNFTRITRF